MKSNTLQGRMAFFNCPYILRTGEVCNRPCYRPEGCKVHWNSPEQFPCKEKGCNKSTNSGYEYCDPHAKKHRAKEQYRRKKASQDSSAPCKEKECDKLTNSGYGYCDPHAKKHPKG